MDSSTHRSLLKGEVGDRFYHVSGEASHAGISAARNIEYVI